MEIWRVIVKNIASTIITVKVHEPADVAIVVLM